MPSVTQRIGNLLGGISQQPDSVKLPGQLRDAINVMPDPTYGLLKRPGLKLVKALTTAATGGRWFSIFRDATNKYIGQFDSAGNLRIWDATTGTEKTVNSITTAAKNYIASVTRADFELLEINDYNFVLNRSKTVAKLSATSASQNPRALVIISAIGYDQKFTVKLNGTEYNYTTVTTGTLSVQDVVNGLKAAIDPGAFNATAVGNVLVIAKDDNADFDIDAYGATLNTSIDAYKGTVPDISRLPGYCTNGFVIQVKAPIGDGGDYWVKFVTENGGSGAGVWEETIAPNIQTTLDPDTMPHVIIRESNGTFTYRSLNQADAAEPDLYWMAREVGDDTTNPFPTLTGQKITGMSFFRNRLVLMSQSNVICSQPGSYFNLFRNSAITTSEADAIDISAGAVKPIDFKYALGDQQGLVLFSDRSQFLLTSGADTFSALTANIQRITTENIDVTTSPVETGTSIIFLDNNQGYTKVTEMVVTSAENRPQTADLTRTVPNLIPSGNRGTVASSSAELVSISVDDPNDTLYVFKYFNRGNERVLASWVKWDMPGEVLLQTIDRDTMYVVTDQESEPVLSIINLLSDASGTAINEVGVPYEYRLDLFDNDPVLVLDGDNTKVYFDTGVYDSTLTPVVVVNESSSQRGLVFTGLTADSDGGGDFVTIAGDFTGVDQVTLGYAYTMELDLPRFYRRQSFSDGTAQSDVVNIPRIHRLVIQSNNSGPFDAVVALRGRPSRTFDYVQRPADVYQLDNPPTPEVVDNSIPIYGKGTDALVTITTETPFPVSFVSMQWYGHYTNRGLPEV